MKKLKNVQNFNKNALQLTPLVKHPHSDYLDQWEYRITEKDTDLIVDFIQTVTMTKSNNQWRLPNVVTDKKFQRFFIPQDFSYNGINKNTLHTFIENIFAIQNSVQIDTLKNKPHQFNIEPIKGFATDYKTLQVSLPYGLYGQYDMSLPVQVMINDHNVSQVFKNYEAQFAPKIVEEVFTKIIGDVTDKQQDNPERML